VREWTVLAIIAANIEPEMQKAHQFSLAGFRIYYI